MSDASVRYCPEARIVLLFFYSQKRPATPFRRVKVMAQVICEVSPGLRESEKTVAVKDVFNRCHHLRVEDGFIASEGGRHYLPIGIVGLDDAKGLALIELAHESDAGISRLWVRQSDLLRIAEKVI
jgi:hypothetical protein